MYEPVFGSTTQILFLFGAFAVLYSTFFVANASHARVFPDALRVCGVVRKDEQSYRRLTRIFSGVFPFLCLIVYVLIPAPLALVLLSGTMQAIMLPMVSLAAIYFRYKKSDSRITPGKFWDAFLWLSALGMLIAGGWFTTAGGTTVNSIARWDGASWSPLGSGMDDWVAALTVYNGELIAGGIFTTAGGQVSAYWARWGPDVPLGDLDGDCNVGILDLLQLLAVWGPCTDCENCTADLDGDCSVGILDLLAVLANWG
ncbi:MAG: hypothetical protein IH989_08295 [Planctomycetes bacterium]|nr:hypothetical protein [Planctomycetota bacterium]